MRHSMKIRDKLYNLSNQKITKPAKSNKQAFKKYQNKITDLL